MCRIDFHELQWPQRAEQDLLVLSSPFPDCLSPLKPSVEYEANDIPNDPQPVKC